MSLAWTGRMILGAGVLALTACSSDEGGEASGGTHAVAVVTVADGLDHPWAVAFAGDDILVTERSGDLRVVRNGQLLDTPVTDVPAVVAEGHGGLLDVVTHPDFANNRRIFLSYAVAINGLTTTRVSSARYENGALSDVRDIFTADPPHSGDMHFGSRLVFDRSGALYITVGERNQRELAQEVDDHAGSIMRVHADGSLPADNLHATNPAALPEIFSIGHRNPQGIALHPDTGAVWASEHGPRGGDELNVIRVGRNYGWPVITYGVDYDGSRIGDTHAPGMEQPITYWTPSIAPSGLAFYTGDRFPRWRGNLFMGALAGRDLYRLVLDGERVVAQERLLTALGQRIRDVRQGPDGLLYVLTDEDQGRLLRLEPADTEP